MLKQILRKSFIIFLCLGFSCAKPVVKDPFVLSHSVNIKILEKQDHNFCSSLKIDFDENNNLYSALYWRCRLSLAKYRLIANPINPLLQQHNLEINDLISKISTKVSTSPESTLMQENKKIDRRQHNQCLSKGYIIATEDRGKIDDYFTCRRALIEQQKVIPPFNNQEYLKHPHNSYNIGFVIDQRVDEEIVLYKAAKKKYPTCVKFHLYGTNFKRCTIAQDNSRNCLTKIDKKKFRKEWKEKIACQKLTYNRFPDRFLKDDDDENARLARANKKSDYYNNHNLASLGLDARDFSSNLEDFEDHKDEKESPKKAINTKDNLYNRFELTKLRSSYITSCQKDADKRVKKYTDEQINICKNMVNFKKFGDN